MPLNLKRRLFKYTRIYKFFLFSGIIFAVAFFFLKIVWPLHVFTKKNNISPQLLKNLFFNQDLPIKSYAGRTNIVLLGFSGGEYDGADLSDSIIFISIDNIKQDIVTISVPRDLWMQSLKAKINTAYHYGEKKKPDGGGMILSKASISEVMGVPVHYGVTLDFSSFQTIIDDVGGVDVAVEESFADAKFPIAGKENDFCGGDPLFSCRYETVSFQNGIQHMDGTKALKYVRSRNATGDEGTDFARSRRQQQVLLALQKKILTSANFKDLQKIINLAKKFDAFVKSDMNWSEKLSLGRLLYSYKGATVRRLSLDFGDQEKNIKGFLVNPPLWQYEGTWVLVPRKDNFDEIHKFVQCHLKDANCQIQP